MRKVKYLLISLVLLLAVGCFKSDKTYEFKSTNTGETIKVTINKDYKLSENEPVKITKDDEEIASMIFITKDNYEELKGLFADKTLIEIEKGDNDEFYLYKVGEDFNYVTIINDTTTGAAVTAKSEDVIKNIKDVIKFSK